MKSPVLSSFSKSEDPKDFIDAFSTCQATIRKDPYRSGILPAPLWAGFVQMPTPFAKEFWIAKTSGARAGTVVGRIGANVSAVLPQTGYVGFFECEVENGATREIATALIDEALKFLKSKGVRKVFGPLNFNTWFPYRFRVGPQDSLKFSWEPSNPPEYVEMFLSAGFAEAERYHSQGVEGLDAMLEKTQGGYESALAEGYTLRDFDMENLLSREVPILHELSMIGFKDNFLFEPIPFAAFRELYVPIANKIDASLSTFAVSPNGKEVGFFFVFKDGDSMVLKTVAVHPEGRGHGLSNAMVFEACRRAKAKGINKSISALVKSGAQSESYAKKARPLWTHEYALFKKEL